MMMAIYYYYYSNNVFSAPGTVPTLELIRQCFGPTRAGGNSLLFNNITYVYSKS